MTQPRLPNVTPALVLGVTSFIGCIVSWGFGGILLSGIALFLANKDRKKMIDSPGHYTNESMLKIARILAIVGLVLSILTAILMVVMLIIFGGITGIQEYVQEVQAQG